MKRAYTTGVKAFSWRYEAVHVQEVAFTASMGVVAVLSRDNPAFSFPAILWAFAALFAFNLGYHAVLRKRGDSPVVPLVSMGVNTVLISWVVHASGGLESYFWPMYLLPVFTAALYLQPRHVLQAALASSAFLTVFYLDLLRDDGPSWRFWELVIKAGVVGLAALVTSQLGRRERVAREALAAARSELDALARPPAQKQRTGSRQRFLDGVLFDLYSQLQSLTGSAELLKTRLGEGTDERRDLERIERSIGWLRSLAGDVLRLSDEDGDEAEVDLGHLVSRTLALVDYKARYRSLRVQAQVPRKGVVVRADRVRLQQALLELLLWVLEQAVEGETVALRLEGAELLIETPTDSEPAAEAATALSALFAPRRATLSWQRADGVLRVKLKVKSGERVA